MPERLIGANALKIHVCDMCDDGQRECKGDESCAILCWINDMPTIEAKPVRHGRWLPVESAHDTRIAKCSICGFWQKSNGNDKTGNYHIHKAVYRYCAACGAKMDGGAENG